MPNLTSTINLNKHMDDAVKGGLKECRVVLESIKLTSASEMDQEMSDTGLRKSGRQRKQPKKFGEFVEGTRQRRAQVLSSDEEELSDFDGEVCPQKPSALFSNDDVEGQDMFKFKSRHTKHDLQNMVKLAISNSPKVDTPLKTPRKSLLKGTASPFGKICEATPKQVKDIMKKRIIKEVDSDSADSDFSASSSDFVPEGSDHESAASSQSGSGSEDSSPRAPPPPPPRGRRAPQRNKNKDSEYIVTPDNYFMMNSSKKIVTSDHTLERLKNFNLNDNMEQQQDILMSAEHRLKVTELNTYYEQLFDKWLYVLSENYNIVLYGVGSKRSVLHRFQEQMLQDYPCIVVNGFFPSLTMKNILESIVIDLLEYTHVPSNIGDVVNLIDTQLTENGIELFLIIHNIDGAMLRNSKAQAMLACLSQIRNVHTLASIDHINAPLLWDHSKLSKFNFTWWDTTTFIPYTEETSFETSLMSHRSGALQLSSLRSVYASLTTNAKGIFNIIIQHQLDNDKQAHYQGLPFRDLYSKSREQFLVSSDVALRAQLTEFLDHRLVRTKRSYDGSENLVIPIENGLLQQFLEQQNS
ncbi:origin recognition complex subunit 2 isoform X1 [Plutella xylostella]|uniref:origin recognition complex subunit 2 isoform X1 n=1 Tax=Plutella xylostella TaxID=51655 RepID=UPI00203316A6|nr:origin recognition complex subunit 2 isoform X1 [Plutella xylostella]